MSTPGRGRAPLWLAFVNSDTEATDILAAFPRWVGWLAEAGELDAERVSAFLRRADQQPAGATAALHDARRLRQALRRLAESGAEGATADADGVAELNRVLGRSAGSRRIEPLPDGGFTRAFVPVGDAFGALLMPVVESAVDALVHGQLDRVRRCAGPRCMRVFHDASRNGTRRWCDMRGCGNRAKAARHRARRR